MNSSAASDKQSQGQSWPEVMACSFFLCVSVWVGVLLLFVIIIILLSFSHHKSGKNGDSLYSDTLLS